MGYELNKIYLKRLEDSRNGTVEVKLNKIICPNCNQINWVEGDAIEVCGFCGGKNNKIEPKVFKQFNVDNYVTILPYAEEPTAFKSPLKYVEHFPIQERTATERLASITKTLDKIIKKPNNYEDTIVYKGPQDYRFQSLDRQKAVSHTISERRNKITGKWIKENPICYKELDYKEIEERLLPICTKVEADNGLKTTTEHTINQPKNKKLPWPNAVTIKDPSGDGTNITLYSINPLMLEDLSTSNPCDYYKVWGNVEDWEGIEDENGHPVQCNEQTKTWLLETNPKAVENILSKVIEINLNKSYLTNNSF